MFTFFSSKNGSVVYYRSDWWCSVAVAAVYSRHRRTKQQQPKKKHQNSKRLFSIDRILFPSLTNSTRSITYHDVILELDCRFMDWSWRLLLSNILNDLWTDFYEAFATQMCWERKKKLYNDSRKRRNSNRIKGEQVEEDNGEQKSTDSRQMPNAEQKW